MAPPPMFGPPHSAGKTSIAPKFSAADRKAKINNAGF